MTDLISRRKLRRSILQEEPAIVIDGIEFLRKDAVLEKIRIAHSMNELAEENAGLKECLKQAAIHGGVCIGCKHAEEPGVMPEECEKTDFDCEKCQSKCPCYTCEQASAWEWGGGKT